MCGVVTLTNNHPLCHRLIAPFRPEYSLVSQVPSFVDIKCSQLGKYFPEVESFGPVNTLSEFFKDSPWFDFFKTGSNLLIPAYWGWWRYHSTRKAFLNGFSFFLQQGREPPFTTLSKPKITKSQPPVESKCPTSEDPERRSTIVVASRKLTLFLFATWTFS